MEAKSSPEACPACKGSRKIIRLADGIDSLPSYLRTVAGAGFSILKCPDCLGQGTLHHEEEGDHSPPPRIEPSKIEVLQMENLNASKSGISFSEDQEMAISAVLDWFYNSNKKRFSLAGFAGTGKTTIIAELLRRLSKLNVRVCAPTGKAASVLRGKLGAGSDLIQSPTTLHKLIYSPESYCTVCSRQVKPLPGKPPRCPNCSSPSIKTRWIRAPFIDADLVVIDESSMLNLVMVGDVESLAGRILYVGDHGQLEPIGEDPGIMRNPDIRLETIHRQASGSGQIQFAHHVRKGNLPRSWDGDGFSDARVVGISSLIPRTLSRYDIILFGYNKTRKDINSSIRDFRGFGNRLPQVGERIICLQNYSDLGLSNGLIVTVQKEYNSYELPRYDIVDDLGNEYFDIQVDPEQFVAEKKIEFSPKGIGLFDFAYAITVHKAQGSEWDSVGVVEQIARTWNPSRWRYTAATRAAKRLEYWIPSGRI